MTRKPIKTVRVSITTAKVTAMIRGLTLLGNETEREIFLEAVRLAIGGDLGHAFTTALRTRDINRCARFCRDGWRLIGNREQFTTNCNMADWLLQMRSLCEKALKEVV